MELGKEEEDHMELPPGFRFHPTDEELITHYLLKKFVDAGFTSRAIGDVDLNKCEPWDLPRRAKMGEKEWYFFCVRDRKYPTGLRTNRATESGYWKATGKDKEIYRGKTLVGMKKTLVFYRDRAPKGQKTDWVMHEFRLEGLRTAKHNEWVISKVFNKSSVGKKVSSLLPPLMDAAHVTCFSNATVGQRGHGGDIFASYFCPPNSLSAAAAAAANPAEFQQNFMSPFYYDSSFMGLMEDDGYGVMRGGCKIEREMLSVSQETGITSTDMNPEISSIVSNDPPTSAGPLQLDECLWNY